MSENHKLREVLQELLIAYEDRVHQGSLDGVAADARQVLAMPTAAPAVPDGLQWFTVAEHGIPEIGAEVIGGLWYTDPWLKPEFATTFMWGQCRVVEDKHRDFKDRKRWLTFGPSHNQITHWARINKPAQAATLKANRAKEVGHGG